MTRLVKKQIKGKGTTVSDTGIVRSAINGTSEITFSIAGQSIATQIKTSGQDQDTTLSWTKDVNPVIAKMGVQRRHLPRREGWQRTAFKLSLRGYDPIYDVRAFTDDIASRRVNLASPDASLMLLKATSAVPTRRRPTHHAIRRLL